jgi:hypothetical protein
VWKLVLLASVLMTLPVSTPRVEYCPSGQCIGDLNLTAHALILATGVTVRGGGTTAVMIAPGFAKGQTYGIYAATQSATFAANPGDASKTLAGIVPAGAILKFVTARVTTAGTNCVSWELGDGTTVDQYCPSGTSKALGTTCDATNAKAATSLNTFGPAARNVVVTAVTGNCFSMVVAVTVVYEKATAATSN